MDRKRDLKARIYRDDEGEWRWRIIAGNGRVLGMSAISYDEKVSCREALELVLSLGPSDVEVRTPEDSEDSPQVPPVI